MRRGKGGPSVSLAPVAQHLIKPQGSGRFPRSWIFLLIGFNRAAVCRNAFIARRTTNWWDGNESGKCESSYSRRGINDPVRPYSSAKEVPSRRNDHVIPDYFAGQSTADRRINCYAKLSDSTFASCRNGCVTVKRWQTPGEGPFGVERCASFGNKSPLYSIESFLQEIVFLSSGKVSQIFGTPFFYPFCQGAFYLPAEAFSAETTFLYRVFLKIASQNLWTSAK